MTSRRDLIPGMAGIPGSGPSGRTCLECSHMQAPGDKYWMNRGRPVTCAASLPVRGRYTKFPNTSPACSLFQARPAVPAVSSRVYGDDWDQA